MALTQLAFTWRCAHGTSGKIYESWVWVCKFLETGFLWLPYTMQFDFDAFTNCGYEVNRCVHFQVNVHRNACIMLIQIQICWLHLVLLSQCESQFTPQVSPHSANPLHCHFALVCFALLLHRALGLCILIAWCKPKILKRRRRKMDHSCKTTCNEA